MRFQIVSERVAAARLLGSGGAYHAFFGAGLSTEAGVPTANQIAEEIARHQLKLNRLGDVPFDSPEALAWLNKHLDWDKPEERYARCIRAHYANPADRVEYFRGILARIRPTFAHHGAAMLMTEGILAPTCLTTNFDKLLENAFAVQGQRECQPLRNESEIKYWRADPRRCFCLKLHGDYDTHNVLNTSEETVRIDDVLRARSARMLDNKGLLVLGLAGFEKSVYSFFEELTTPQNLANGALERGLLWGVYVGAKPSGGTSQHEVEDQIDRAVQEGAIGPEIRKMMERLSTANVQCAFFPVYGSGQFLIDVIEQSERKSLIGRAEPLLDHEIRMRRVFARARLSAKRVTDHIANLNRVQNSVAKASGSGGMAVERAFEIAGPQGKVWLAYGDISKRAYLGHQAFRSQIKAVVSPDDTYLSVGGGAAAALAEKAGMRETLHEVSKFVPVPQGETRVTSAGRLPAHYIIHAATIEVAEDGYLVSPDDVKKTFLDALRRAAALQVQMLSVPLLGAGVAGMEPETSFTALVEAYASYGAGVPALVVFVVFREAQLSRTAAKTILETQLGTSESAYSKAPWPEA